MMRQDESGCAKVPMMSLIFKSISSRQDLLWSNEMECFAHSSFTVSCQKAGAIYHRESNC